MILSTASPVFEAMFYGYFQSEPIITIVDVAAHTFKLMLEFIYTDHINDSDAIDTSKDSDKSVNADDCCTTIETCVELFYCAEKYLLHSLRDKCLWKIHNKLNNKNILRVLDFALGAGIVPLQELCLKTLRVMLLTNMKQFRRLTLQTTTDYHMSVECLQYIVAFNRTIFERDDIDISILVMIKQWCRNEADDRRRQLDEVDGNDHDRGDLYGHVLNELNLPPAIAAAILNDEHKSPPLSDACFLDAFEWSKLIGLNNLKWLSCFRNAYKSNGIAKIYAGQVHIVCIEANRTIALKTLVVNSRLSLNALLPLANDRRNERRGTRFSPIWPVVANRTYDDEFSVKFLWATDNEILYSEKFQLKNVEFNSKMYLTFRQPVVVARDQRMRIVFERPSTASECFSEYPCKLYKSSEDLDDGLHIDFNPETGENVKCILDGIEYAQIG